MPYDVILPKLGTTMDEGTLLRWMKKVGDPVRKGEPLFEVQTDKVNLEVEAPADGVLAKILCEPNQTAKVAEVIAVIAVGGESLEAASAPAGRAVAAPVAVAAEAHAAAAAEAPTGQADASSTTRLFSSPAARRLARELGIELATAGIRGSGPNGRIIEKDVLAYRESMAGESTVVMPAVGAAPAAGPASDANLVPLSPTRRVTAQRMAESARTVPHFYLTVDVRAQGLVALRERLLAAAPGAARISYSDLLVKAVALTLRAHPLLNASWAGGQVRINPDVHLGLAMAGKDGLRVPVFHRADTMSLADLARRRGQLEARNADGKLALADLEGATFTVSNLGMFGIDAFQAIINPPQAAILAVGRIAERPVAENGQVVARPLMTLTLGADHRVCDGADAARFLQALRAALESPAALA